MMGLPSCDLPQPVSAQRCIWLHSRGLDESSHPCDGAVEEPFGDRTSQLFYRLSLFHGESEFPPGARDHDIPEALCLSAQSGGFHLYRGLGLALSAATIHPPATWAGCSFGCHLSCSPRFLLMPARAIPRVSLRRLEWGRSESVARASSDRGIACCCSGDQREIGRAPGDSSSCLRAACITILPLA